MILSIRKPPALNGLYGTNKWGTRFVKPEGQAWKEELVYLIRTQMEEEMVGEVSLSFTLYTSKHQDIDSVLKILLDSIQASEIIKDDFQITELHGKKIRCKKSEEKIEFELCPIKKEE